MSEHRQNIIMWINTADQRIFRQKTAGFPVYQTEKIWKDIKYGYVTGVL